MRRPPRVAVVGAGYWGKNLIRNLAALEALEMVVELDADRRGEFAKQYGGIRFEADLDAALNEPSIDAVVIATPAVTHARMVEAALMADKDVFVEKPLSLAAEEGRRLVALADKRQRVLMVGHLLWYHPAVLELHRLVQDGTLGKLRYISSNRLNMGKLRREENVLWSFAPHDISVILGLVGRKPVEVTASGGAYLSVGVADVTLTQMQFPEGERGFVFVSWLHPFKEQKLTVVGEKQMAVFDDRLDWPDKLKLYPHDVLWRNGTPEAAVAETVDVALTPEEPLRAECVHFLECVATRAQPRTDGPEALAVLETLERAEACLQEQGLNVD